MVNMNDVEMEDPLEEAKKEAFRLGNEKMKLEDELKEWLSILTKVRKREYDYCFETYIIFVT